MAFTVKLERKSIYRLPKPSSHVLTIHCTCYMIYPTTTHNPLPRQNSLSLSKSFPLDTTCDLVSYCWDENWMWNIIQRRSLIINTKYFLTYSNRTSNIKHGWIVSFFIFFIKCVKDKKKYSSAISAEPLFKLYYIPMVTNACTVLYI